MLDKSSVHTPSAISQGSQAFKSFRFQSASHYSSGRRENCHRVVQSHRDDHSHGCSPTSNVQKASDFSEHGRDRRSLLAAVAFGTAATALQPGGAAIAAQPTATSDVDGLRNYGKSKILYPGYVLTDSGLQYNDLREGDGKAAVKGSNVVVDWTGYTIGYYGRPFEATNKTKGSAFTGENKEYLRFQLGTDQVIAGWEEAIIGIKEGGIRRIVVPEELSYPKDGWDAQGPRPSTVSGRRTLGFVLQNRGYIDATLLFDISLIRID